jgi:hypothetical protein
LVALLAGVDVEVEDVIEALEDAIEVEDEIGVEDEVETEDELDVEAGVVDENEVEDEEGLDEAGVAELELLCDPRPPKMFENRPRASIFDSIVVSTCK